jgi:hypothetical protein
VAPATGTGTGSFSYRVAANTGVSRAGTITVGGRTITVNQTGVTGLTLAPSALAFGSVTVGSSSAALTLTVRNANTSLAQTISALSFGGAGAADFRAVGSAVCKVGGVLAATQSCTLDVSFTPSSVGTRTATLSVTTAVGTTTATLQGDGAAASLVDRYYVAILGRVADASGKAYWDGEVARMQALGVDPKEAYRVMAGYFFNSAEYLARNRSNAAFVTDLYNTFLNRAPDSGGLSYWTGLLASGMPRDVVMYSFEFSTEFNAYMAGILGNTTGSATVATVVDYYRGLLRRLPDSAGFAYWLGRFQTAQCAGTAQIAAEANAISQQLVTSAEYVSRDAARAPAARNAGFVQDLYDALLRRGSDLAGFQYWVGQLDAGTLSRDQVRRSLLGSPEFQGRIAAIAALGCDN